MLQGKKILLVEDEAFVALDLAAAIEAMGGTVIGPFIAVEEALRAVEETAVSGAILDVNLADREVTPLAVALVGRGVTVVLHTGGTLPPALERTCPDLPLVRKPAPSATVVSRLIAELAN